MKRVPIKQRQKRISEGMRLAWALRKAMKNRTSPPLSGETVKLLEQLRQFEEASRKVVVHCD